MQEQAAAAADAIRPAVARAPRPPRVVIVEELSLVAEVLQVGLAHRFDPHVVATQGMADTASVVDRVFRMRPVVALVDLDLGPLISAEALVATLSRSGVAVLVTSNGREPARWGACLRRGASGVLTKEAGLAALIRATELASEGKPVLDPRMRERLRNTVAADSDRARLGRARARLARLTQREREVLGLLMRGLGAREIAHRNVVSEATVRTQIKAILTKLDVPSQLSAVALAWELRWRPS